MSQYLLRGYKWDTRIPTHDTGGSGADIYGPSAALVAWAANPPSYPGWDYSEQLVDFSVNGQNQASNTGIVFLRAGMPGEAGRDVAFLGLVDPGWIGAHRSGTAKQATPLAVIAHPSGRVHVEGAGGMTFAPGALVFQL